MNRFAALQAQTEPAFSSRNPNLYVRFATRRFRNARVAWLNRRWFLSQGIDFACEAQRNAIESWLVETFGVAVPAEDDPDEQYLSVEQHLYADRYGAPSGSPHGGSGRVGTFGAFNAKGIGRTPLASTQSDWYHSHGCMFLEEAIREAVLSEVAAAVFPHSAIPTIAIIDAGASLRWRDGTIGARRAIAVRPAFLRVASLMRTIYFGTSGRPGSDQVMDAASVSELWKGVGTSDVHEALSRIGVQYGFGNALRLWPGPLFPSNFTLDGELLDFGSFRALPSWRCARGESRAHSFGGETTLAAATARSLSRNALRCGLLLAPSEMLAAFQDGWRRGFSTALSRYEIGPDSDFAKELNELRANQHRIVTDLAGGIDAGVQFGPLRPWTALYREELLADTENVIRALDEGPLADSASVSDFIEGRIANSYPEGAKAFRIGWHELA